MVVHGTNGLTDSDVREGWKQREIEREGSERKGRGREREMRERKGKLEEGNTL